MSSQVVTVAIPGTRKELVLETDPATGRTAGRVDGRAVMRPLAANEDEREFTVGSLQYVLRRMDDGGFDVDITLSTLGAPRDPIAAYNLEASFPPKETKSRFAVSSVVVGLVLLLGWRVASRSLRTFFGSFGDPVEVTSFTCEPAGRGEFEAVVLVRNLSSVPMELTGHITLVGMGKSQLVPFEARVEPAPLPPDATGRLYIRGYQPDSFRLANGDCRLDPFTDAAGKRVRYREAKKA